MPRTHPMVISLPAISQTYAQPLYLPISLLRHLWHVSLNMDLFAFLKYWNGRWKKHQRSDHHIQVPTDRFWGCVNGFYEIMPPYCLPTGSKFKLCEFLLTFLEVYKFTTFCDWKVYRSLVCLFSATDVFAAGQKLLFVFDIETDRKVFFVFEYWTYFHHGDILYPFRDLSTSADWFWLEWRPIVWRYSIVLPLWKHTLCASVVVLLCLLNWYSNRWPVPRQRSATRNNDVIVLLTQLCFTCGPPDGCFCLF